MSKIISQNIDQKFKTLIFDIDGTLWDATSTISEALNRVAKEHNLDATITAEDIRVVSGLPHDQCMEKILGYEPDDQLDQLMDKAEQKNLEKKGGRLYPYVRGGLKLLKTKYRLFLVSNCSRPYLKNFLQHSGLGEVFEGCLCYGDTGLPKGQTIRQIMQEYDVNPSESVYIGDTGWDQDASHDAGIDFIFVSYGFGSLEKESLYSVGSFQELVKGLMK